MKTAGIALMLPVLLLGCAFEEETSGQDREGIGQVPQAFKVENELAPNALAGNALAGNALAGNALAGNALAGNALAAIQAPDEEGALARLLLKYVVSCALTPTDSVSFTWNDGTDHPETYWGLVGLAPDWATQAATEPEQKWVTACLGARTNYYAITVMISMRGPHGALTLEEGEGDDYAWKEGAFWGNLFDETPYMKSCGIEANADHSRAKQRDCAVGHLDGSTVTDCGMIEHTGDCSPTTCIDNVTTPVDDPDDGYASCDGAAEVITTYLAD